MSNSNLNLIESMLKEILELIEEEKKNGNTVYTTNSTDNITYNSNLRDKIVEIARKYIGRKYVYGGKDIETGIDCSGFTQLVYKEAGVKGIPQSWVNSTGQRQWGVEVKSPQLDNARPGDLVCYQGHVAIYVGNNKIIDAGSSVKGVSERNVDIMHIITIRNVIGD